jgi:hypothetical protein
MEKAGQAGKKCPFCGEEISPDALKCWFCCLNVQPRTCVKCGTQNPPAAQVCASCGGAIEAPGTHDLDPVSEARQLIFARLAAIKLFFTSYALELVIFFKLLFGVAILSIWFAIGHVVWECRQAANLVHSIQSDEAQADTGAPVISLPSTGDLAVLWKVIELNFRSMQGSSPEFQAFSKKLRELHLENVLAINTLEDVYSSERNITVAQKIVGAYSKSYEERIAEIDIYAVGVSLPESAKKDFFAGYNKSREEAVTFVRHFIAIQNETLNNMRDVTVFVKTKGDFSDGRFGFSNQEDEKDYTAKAAKVISALKKN